MEYFFKKAVSFLDRAPELWRENVDLVELNRRFLWFLLLRFGVAVALLFLGLTKSLVIPDILIPPVDFFLIAGVLLLLNAFYWFHYDWATTRHEFPNNARMVAQNVQIQIILDFLILGSIAYECGGLESPLIYFFLFHNTLSCLFFRRWRSFLHTLLSIAIVFAIFLLPKLGILPEKHFIDPSRVGILIVPRDFSSYYLTGVVSLYLVSWYLISTITESLKEQERALQEKVQEMIDLSREKTRYLLVTTHELKAPFAAIQSYVNVALGGFAGEVPERLRDIFKKIGARCDLLGRRITEMIQLANLTSLKEQREKVSMSHINLSEAILDVLGHFREPASARGISFDIGDMLMREHDIVADHQQIDILFNNLIANAVSYSFPNTRIDVAIEESEKWVTARVTNQGIGIRREHLEKVFLEHFREERAAQENPNSTGLGLTIARQIMDIHRGRIWIESDENKMTSVFTEFPKSS